RSTSTRARKAPAADTASVGADVAATETGAGETDVATIEHRPASNRVVSDSGSMLLSAALALPGILPCAAAAQTMPDQSVIALQYFDYRDWQPGATRMKVRSPSLYVLRPIADDLALEGNLVYDSMSGASPLAF